MSAREKSTWVLVIAATLLVEGVLIILAYETGFTDFIKRMFTP